MENQFPKVGDSRLAASGNRHVRESRLVVPRLLQQQVLQRLLEHRAERTVLLRVGHAALSDGVELWLARELVSDRSELPGADRQACFFAATRHDGSGSMPFVESQLDAHPLTVAGEIFYGEGSAWQDKAWGFTRRQDGSRYAALSKLILPGSGMEEMPLLAQTSPWPPPLDPADRERLSRTIGAFGAEGGNIVARMRAARYVLAGVSRSGGFILEWLGRLGADVTIFDPKRIQLAHLGEAGLLFAPEDIGHEKAQRAAYGLVRSQRVGPSHTQGTAVRIRAIAESIDSPVGALLAKEATVLIDCGDTDAMRLATAILATVYHKVQLSIATGIQFDAEGKRSLGADIRLILPGDRCLRCCGDLANYPRALRELTTDRRLLSPEADSRDWQSERAGSLRSLNQTATGIALRLLEDLFAGRIHNSRWTRIEFNESGSSTILEPALGSRLMSCPLCKKWGEGDAAISV